jgi:hypothetical protein
VVEQEVDRAMDGRILDVVVVVEDEDERRAIAGDVVDEPGGDGLERGGARVGQCVGERHDPRPEGLDRRDQVSPEARRIAVPGIERHPGGLVGVVA